MESKLLLLRKAIKYALENSSFNKLNLVEQAEHVCVFGLGKYFNEAFVSKGMKKAYNVDLLCDNNPEKWGCIIEGIPCINPKELQNYNNVIVIIMLGNPLSVQEQLNEMGIPWVTHTDLSLDEMVCLPKEKSWFENQVIKIEEALRLFEDKESQNVYVNGICNRIAYPIAECSWKDMCSKGEYFEQPFMPMGNNETYVDCGAYNGDTILRFVDCAKTYKSIYGFELDYENFEVLKNAQRHMKRFV